MILLALVAGLVAVAIADGSLPMEPREKPTVRCSADNPAAIDACADAHEDQEPIPVP